MAGPVELGDDDYETLLPASPGVTLVEVWAPNCGPCTAQKRSTQAFAAEYGERIQVARINGAAATGFCRRYGVRAVPTLLVFRAGQMTARLLGNHSVAELKQALITPLPAAG